MGDSVPRGGGCGGRTEGATAVPAVHLGGGTGRIPRGRSGQLGGRARGPTMLHNKLWLARMQERHVLEQIQQSGATTKILRIKKAGKLVSLAKIWDTANQKVVTGDKVREVAAREAQQKNTLPTSTPTLEWVQEHKPRGSTGRIHDRTAGAAPAMIAQESKGRVAHTLCYTMRYGEGRELALAQRNITVAMDGIAAGVVQHAKVAYHHMQKHLLLTTPPPPQLPTGCLRVLHLSRSWRSCTVNAITRQKMYICYNMPY